MLLAMMVAAAAAQLEAATRSLWSEKKDDAGGDFMWMIVLCSFFQ